MLYVAFIVMHYDGCSSMAIMSCFEYEYILAPTLFRQSWVSGSLVFEILKICVFAWRLYGDLGMSFAFQLKSFCLQICGDCSAATDVRPYLIPHIRLILVES